MIGENANSRSVSQTGVLALTGEFETGHQIRVGNFLFKDCHLNSYSIQITPYQPIIFSADFNSYDVDKMFQPRTGAITNKALTSNVATLTSTAHTFTVGMEVVVTGVDATFNGEYRITAVTANTFSYAKTATDVTSTAATGSATSDVIHFIDYISGTDEPVFAICDDGTNAYWVTNTGGKLTVYKKALTGDSTTAATKMFDTPSIVVANATMAFIKERIVMCVNNSVYEFSTTATAMPTAIYTNSATRSASYAAQTA